MNYNLTAPAYEPEYETFQEALDRMLNNIPTGNNTQPRTFVFTYPDLTPEEVQTLHAIEDEIAQEMMAEQVIKEARENERYHQMYEESCAEQNAWELEQTKWELEQTIECDMDEYERRQYYRSRRQRRQRRIQSHAQEQNHDGYVLK